MSVQKLDFSDHLFRCHSLSHIMTETKSWKEMYDEAMQKYNIANERFYRYYEEYDNTKDKSTKTAEKKYQSIQRYEVICKDLKQIAEEYKPKVGTIRLSEGCITHLSDIYASKKVGINLEKRIKYFEKGLMCEEDAITIYSRVTKTMFRKNKERKSNGYITGEIDFPSGKQKKIVIHDTKVSWDIYTFYRAFSKGILNQVYDWQFQGYFDLWETDEGKLIYVLVDTPEKLIENEKRRLLRDFTGTKEQYEEACEIIEKAMKFGDTFDLKERIIEFPVHRDDEKIARIKPQVEACREYLNNFKPNSYVD